MIVRPNKEIAAMIKRDKELLARLESLPQTITSVVEYRKEILTSTGKWAITYTHGNKRFANVTAEGSTLEEAVNRMIDHFENHPEFEKIRTLLK